MFFNGVIHFNVFDINKCHRIYIQSRTPCEASHMDFYYLNLIIQLLLIILNLILSISTNDNLFNITNGTSLHNNSSFFNRQSKSI